MDRRRSLTGPECGEMGPATLSRPAIDVSGAVRAVSDGQLSAALERTLRRGEDLLIGARRPSDDAALIEALRAARQIARSVARDAQALAGN